MNKTMEISKNNTNALKRALKAVDENGVKEIIGYGYDNF